MNTHADMIPKNQSQSVANAVSRKRGGDESAFKFADNRPEAAAQRVLQEMADNRPQVKQLIAFKEMVNNHLESNHSIQRIQQFKINNQSSNIIQRYDFTNDVEDDDWAKLSLNLESKIAEYAGIIDVDMDHIEERHINESEEATHFSISWLGVLKLIKSVLANPSIRWIKEGSIMIEQDTGIAIGANGETKIRIFVSTKAMDNAGDWQDAWVTTAYPF